MDLELKLMDVLRRVVSSGVNKSELARLLGIGRSTLYYWLNGKCRPTKIPLYKLERLFDLFEDRLVNDYHSLNHGGPPNNYFSYSSSSLSNRDLKMILKGKRSDGSRRTYYQILTVKNKAYMDKAVNLRMLKACLTKLTFYAGLMGVTYKVLLDDAALILRSYLKENKVKRKYAGELALAALKIAGARMLYKLDEERLQQILSEGTVDQEKYKEYIAELAKNHL